MPRPIPNILMKLTPEVPKAKNVIASSAAAAVTIRPPPQARAADLACSGCTNEPGPQVVRSKPVPQPKGSGGSLPPCRCTRLRRRSRERFGLLVNDSAGVAGAPLRAVLVGDQALVRAGIGFILSTEPGITVVAEGANGDEGVTAVTAHRPSVVLMDIRMPVMDGLEATRRIRDQDGPPVLVLTTFDDDEVLRGAVQAGAAGYLLKDTLADDLIQAVRIVADGGSWLDPRVTPRLLTALRSAAPSALPDHAEIGRLSERELEVLPLIAAGSTNVEIAAHLYPSERMVKGHVGSIFTKLGTRDCATAIVLAYESGVVVPGA